jgi:hypothetical protein
VQLQDVFDSIWQAMIDVKVPITSRDDLSRMIISSHEAGMEPETIKAILTTDLAR